MPLLLLSILNADRAPPLQKDPRDLCPRNHGEVRTLERWPQIAGRGAGAAAVCNRAVERLKAFVLGSIEIGCVGISGLSARLDPCRN